MFNEQLVNIWDQLLQLVKQDIPKPSFDTWFQGSSLVAYYGTTLIVKTKNEFAKNALESTYQDKIKFHLEQLLNHSVKINFVTVQDIDQKSPEDLIRERSSERTENPETERNDFGTHGLIPRYTFDTFVIGKGNQFAHAASLSVAEGISVSLHNQKNYNPLFIYGGAGLGKTHLMHAIAHHVLEHNPAAKIKYVTSEKFTNELIDGIRDNKSKNFRNKYRKVDILLIDDIQFLSKKEGTQEEFFHTFNDLYEANKQIIISSDRPPKEISTLEERLRTRFEWGLITDIQAPDLETRIAILRKKAQIESLDIDNEVLTYIAENIESNIRELEGALLRLTAYSTLNNREANLDLAKECLSNFIVINQPIIVTGDAIKEQICEMYALRMEDLIGKKRSQNLAYPRQIAMYLCRELTDMSLPKIGEIFGGRDHTTVIHAYDKIQNELKKNPALKGAIETVKKNLNVE